jgi:hypothetical protein
VPLDGPLPGEEFLNRQGVAQACPLEAHHADANGPDDRGFAAYRPTLGVGWGKFDHCASRGYLRHGDEMGGVSRVRLIISAKELITGSPIAAGARATARTREVVQTNGAATGIEPMLPGWARCIATLPHPQRA